MSKRRKTGSTRPRKPRHFCETMGSGPESRLMCTLLADFTATVEEDTATGQDALVAEAEAPADPAQEGLGLQRLERAAWIGFLSVMPEVDTTRAEIDAVIPPKKRCPTCPLAEVCAPPETPAT